MAQFRIPGRRPINHAELWSCGAYRILILPLWDRFTHNLIGMLLPCEICGGHFHSARHGDARRMTHGLRGLHGIHDIHGLDEFHDVHAYGDGAGLVACCLPGIDLAVAAGTFVVRRRCCSNARKTVYNGSPRRRNLTTIQPPRLFQPQHYHHHNRTHNGSR
jgi:hypothetical protein